ncbi:MFS transporter [Rickettsia endosymbiont of Culicoides newsteadi]|uniref:MFS transporter n=1 Tax=Rickettsia endosymbiont of Culicoides newsteadi TaxID=1961830 RepID=UPI000B9C2E7E|nr:MFS transporter [Rickettsia endosymbiont of Culicoides newsteadi]OZG31393.1 MFS transporter [Rickettsia endosymbiont of Culicoides newsteadi]
MKEKTKNKIIGAFLGTIIEYYDYSLYGFSAGIIAAKFFPNTDYITSLINAFAVYAMAYLSKPIGSLIFGRIGDIYGRKTALTITIIGIVIPTMIIGCLPDYSSIGVWSTVILVLCRITQGIFVAGEYDGAAIYVIEHLGEKYRYTASAITRCTGVLGLLLGIGATNFFSSHIFPDWGWRIPFLISLPLALVTLYFRRKLDETPEFKKNQANGIRVQSLATLVNKQWRIILMVVFLAGGFGVTYQLSIMFMKQYLPMILPQTSFIMSVFSVLITVCFAIAMPISGLFADRFNQMIVFKISLFGTLVASLLFIISVNYQMVNLALGSCLMLACFVAPFNALAHGTMIKAFAVNDRYRAISLGHTMGAMLMSGSANYVCLVLMRYLNFKLFPMIYLIFFVILAYLMVKRFEKDYKRKIKLQPDISIQL